MKISASKGWRLAWLFVFGIFFFLVWLISGFGLILTIIFIPFGIQCIKIAEVMLNPFERFIQPNFEKHPIVNIIWAFTVGWQISLVFLILSVLSYITILFKRFSKLFFYLSLLSLIPFGADY